jgi:hypothetical protein
MSAESGTPVKIAEQHRELQNQLAAADEVVDVQTRCEGPRTATSQPTFTSEVVLAAEADGVGPVVLEAIADCELSLIPQPPQGPHTIIQVE